MKKLAILTACVSALSAFTTIGASAQMSDTQKMSNMDANARMMKHHHRHHHMKHHMMMKKKMMKDGM